MTKKIKLPTFLEWFEIAGSISYFVYHTKSDKSMTLMDFHLYQYEQFVKYFKEQQNENK